MREYLADHDDQERRRRYINGYRTVPPADPDGWGDLAASADRDGHELAQRLEAEERAHVLTLDDLLVVRASLLTEHQDARPQQDGHTPPCPISKRSNDF